MPSPSTTIEKTPENRKKSTVGFKWLEELGAPELLSARQEVAQALQQLCASDPEQAATILKLPATQRQGLEWNAHLAQPGRAAALAVYTGVLYQKLAAEELPEASQKWLAQRLRIVSALYGLVRIDDVIAPYRLNGAVQLPDVGSLVKFWQPRLSAEITRQAEADPEGPLVLDMLSQPYQRMWRAPGDVPYAQVKIMTTGPKGQRIAVSHHNKATKGELLHALALAQPELNTLEHVVAACRNAGFNADVNRDTKGVDQLEILIASKP